MPTTDENPNHNCLAGMSCPSCGDFGPFSIQATQSGPLRVSDDGTDFIEGNVEWADEAQCECLACHHQGTVAEFRGEPAPSFDTLQQQVIEVYADGEYVCLTPAGVSTCGDTLLKFLLSELSTQEDCKGVQDAVDRRDTAMRELAQVRAAFLKQID